MKTLLFHFIFAVASPAFADDYTDNWSMSLGCPAHHDTSGSGSISMNATGFSVGGTCTRLANGFAKFALTGASGGSLVSATRYPLFMTNIVFVPPIRSTDTTPIFGVAAECPTATRTMNWIYMQGAAARTGEWFWGTSTMTPTSTTMTKYYNVGGTQLWSGSYSLAVGTCSSGLISVTGSNDEAAKLYVSNDWAGFYKTSPGNISYVAVPWEINTTYLASKTYHGQVFVSQSSSSYSGIKVISNGTGLVYTITRLSGTDMATDSSSYDTMTITNVDSPSVGMMRGTISAYDSFGDPIGTTESIGCIASDTGPGGLVLTCSGKNPENNTQFRSMTFNYKAADGSLDATFSSDGYTTESHFHTIKSVALQSNGKIVAAGWDAYDYTLGYPMGGGLTINLARFNTDGTLDTTFSGDGLQTAYPTSDPISFMTQSVALDSTGKIYVGGTAIYFDGFDTFQEHFVARFTSTGTLDTAFSGDGIAWTSPYTSSEYSQEGYAVAVDSSDRPLLAGRGHDGDYDVGFSIFRYTTTGAFDTTFSSDGKEATSGGALNLFNANAMTIDASGKPVLAGYAGGGFAVARYTTAGVLDTTFSGDGIVVTNHQSSAQAKSVAIQSDGKVVIGGHTTVSGILQSMVARFSSAGVIDTTFGTSGITTAAYGTNHNNYIQEIAIQSDGKIVGVGTYDENDGSGIWYYSLMRFTSNGQFDSSLGGDGVLQFGTLDNHGYGHSIKIDSSGRYMTGGRFAPGSGAAVGTLLRYTP